MNHMAEDPKALMSPASRYQTDDNSPVLSPVDRAEISLLKFLGSVFMVLNAWLGYHDQNSSASERLVYSGVESVSSLAGPLVIALLVNLVTVLVLSWIIRFKARPYLTVKAIAPSLISRSHSFSLARVLRGYSRAPLEDFIVRVVAANVEEGTYKKRNGAEGRKKKTFAYYSKAVLLFEKKLSALPAYTELAEFMHERIAWNRVYEELLPPIRPGQSFGIGIRWEIQIIHPAAVDKELRFKQGFSEAEFWSAFTERLAANSHQLERHHKLFKTLYSVKELAVSEEEKASLSTPRAYARSNHVP